MADISVENNETPVIEKEVEECDAPKVAETEEAAATTETTTNGSAEEVKENGTETDAAAPTTTTEEPASEEAADEPAAETNGDSTVTSEALKRKSTVGASGDAAEDAAVVEGDEATPEKKAKLDAAPEEAQPEVGESEAAEVAA